MTARPNIATDASPERPTRTSLELCAGMGGQALGLERAGFEHLAVVEIEADFCATLKKNRPDWTVLQEDLRGFSGLPYRGDVDLLSGGVPCPPFSVAGEQLGAKDSRDLFPDALRIARESEPKAIMLENVKGLLDPRFGHYRERLKAEFVGLGYVGFWKLLRACDYGVPQLRPRVVVVALRACYAPHFVWPEGGRQLPPTVGETLEEEMAAGGWEGATRWASQADAIAPTLVGGSKKHGGPDLGPTRAKAAWAKLGVNGRSLADTPPAPGFEGTPRLTVKMAALIQGFPASWEVVGKKTQAYRQVGNALPPPVAEAAGRAIMAALDGGDRPQSA